jgi:hypothetical protein
MKLLVKWGSEFITGVVLAAAFIAVVNPEMMDSVLKAVGLGV